MKMCPKCETLKSFDEFYKDSRTKDGLYTHCKECHAKYYAENRKEIRVKQAEHYQENRERLLDKQNTYSQDHKAEKAKYDAEYREKNKNKIKDRLTRYSQSERGKEVINNTHKRYLAIPENRHKHKARGAVNEAVRHNRIPRASGLKCAHCPNQASEYHHYLGYEKEHWLDVIPLCEDCHTKLD